VSLSRAVLEADIIISLPKFKTHGLTVLTGAIKNSYGFLPGAQKARLHAVTGSPERFQEMLVDLFRLRVPEMFIVDAVVGMEGNGPASTDLRDIGLILASDNGVAMDAVIAAMMGCEPGRLPFLRWAKERGLGDYDLGTIGVIGELRTLPGFKLPPGGGGAALNNDGLQAVIQRRIAMRPRVDPGLCTGCGTCVDQCPVSALRMNDHLPAVDVERCIACFCCQEVCPEKAVALKESIGEAEKAS
jgi:ferredoxin